MTPRVTARFDMDQKAMKILSGFFLPTAIRSLVTVSPGFI
jgi:hypothetical protein